MGRYYAKRALLRPVVAERSGQTERRTLYRVEHQTGDTSVVLAHLPTAVAHPAELDRFAAPLQAAGQSTGRIVLIEEPTDRVVAQRALARPMRIWRRTATQQLRPALRRLADVAPSPAPSAANQTRRGP